MIAVAVLRVRYTELMWTETALWQQLSTRNGLGDQPLRAEVARALTTTEAVLSRAGTSPTHFTLHDADHSRRVAERMATIIPPGTYARLSSHELALLLLSAYLHDIGMTPAAGLLEAHRALLIDGAPNDLSEDQRHGFQAWLDQTHPGVELATSSQPITSECLARIDVIVAHYARHQHIEWGVRWIDENLTFELPAHRRFRDHLIGLVRSHGEGLPELLAERFDPIFLVDGTTVHLRYLAAVLRIADVLDVDPERTPAIVFQHRRIDDSSVTYWHKDHELTITLDGGIRVIAEAAPTSAQMHFAIVETVDEIEQELRLVHTLAAEKPFEQAPLRTTRLPHTWGLQPLTHRRIEPKDGAYEYIDAGFRPDTEKLLDLLVGRAIYDTELSAVRELLQNAFDAVRERIGLQQLEHASKQSLLDAVVAAHAIRLDLTRDDDGRLWLHCSDSGAGMSKEIVTKRLLVSGSSPTPELLGLRRRLKASGRQLERTGQWGIGVLSYFMLADSVAIETRRCGEAPSRESNGWSFTTDGVGSFGELRRTSREEPGTRVSLRLRAELATDERELWKRLKQYLDGVLVLLPCSLEISARSLDETFRLPSGWVDSRRALVWREVDELTCFSPDDRETDLQQGVEWLELDEPLPNRLGRWTAAIPYFHTPLGMSLVDLSFTDDSSIDRLVVSEFRGWPDYLGRIPITQSWWGVAIEQPSTNRLRRPPLVRIDWRADAAGAITVSRGSLRPTRAAEAAREHVEQRVVAALETLVTTCSDSSLRWLNARLLPKRAEPRTIARPIARPDDHWFVREQDGEGGHVCVWRQLTGPIVESPALLHGRFRPLLLGGRPVSQLDLPESVMTSVGSLWGDTRWPPDRLVLDVDLQQFARVWDGPDSAPVLLDGVTPIIRLPDELADVAVITHRRFTAVNLAHPVVRLAASENGVWRSSHALPRQEQPADDALLASPATAAAWLLSFATNESADLSEIYEPRIERWNETCAEAPGLVSEATQRAGAITPLLRLDLEEDGPFIDVTTFTPTGALSHQTLAYQLFAERCAETSREWRLTEQ